MESTDPLAGLSRMAAAGVTPSVRAMFTTILAACDAGTKGRDVVALAATLARAVRDAARPSAPIGSRGHGSLGRVAFGSTSDGLVRRADTPALVVSRAAATDPTPEEATRCTAT